MSGKEQPATPVAETTPQSVQPIDDFARVEQIFAKYPEYCQGIVDRAPLLYRQAEFNRIPEPMQLTVRRVLNSLFTDEPVGLFLTGDVGTGKSMALRVIERFACVRVDELARKARLAYEAGEIDSTVYFGKDPDPRNQVCFTTHQQLIDSLWEIRKLERSNPFLWREFLFIDELGTVADDERGWNLALLYQLIDHRYSNLKPTFVALNTSEKEFREWPGWSRIADRLLDARWIIRGSMGRESLRPKTRRQLSG